MRRGVQYISKDKREYILSLNWCFYCQSICENPHIEHIISVKAGGSSGWDNLTSACAKCNGFKGSYSLGVFLNRMMIKRDAVISKVYGYCYRVKRMRAKNISQHEINQFINRINNFRSLHSYYTRIIDSILNKKYIMPSPELKEIFNGQNT